MPRCRRYRQSATGKPSDRTIDPVFPKSRPLKVGIPVGHVGLAGIARPGDIGANRTREGEPVLSAEYPIPLPASDQLVHHPAGAAPEALPGPKRQLIAVTRVELVLEAE